MVSKEAGWTGDTDADVLTLEHALNELEQVDNRSCQTLELRFFAGLTDEESAEVLGVSIRRSP